MTETDMYNILQLQNKKANHVATNIIKMYKRFAINMYLEWQEKVKCESTTIKEVANKLLLSFKHNSILYLPEFHIVLNQSIYHFIYLYIYPSIILSIYHIIHHSFYLSIYLYIHLSFHLSIYLSIIDPE